MATITNTSFRCFLLTAEYISTIEQFRLKSQNFRIYTFVPSVILIPLIAIGNGLVLIALLRWPSLRTSSNLLICCLSFADLLVGLLFLPIYAAWNISDRVLLSCPMSGLLSFCGWLVNSASFGGIIAICIERYVALFYHLKYHSLISKKRIIKAIVFLWFLSAVFSIMSLFPILDLIRFPVLGTIFITGLAVIVFTYSRIFALVRRHHRSIRAQQTTNTPNFQQRKLAVTMAYVIGTSLICYLPVGCAIAFVIIQQGFSRKSFHFFHLSELLFCLSSLINPIIYCLRNREMRTSVFSLLRISNESTAQLNLANATGQTNLKRKSKHVNQAIVSLGS